MQRIKSLDLARGFTVLMMAPIHSILLYGNPAIYHSLVVKSLGFIAEGPGAQLFMLLMGVYFAFQKQSFSQVLKKVLLILIAAYALNLFKFVIPLSCKILPAAMLTDLQVQDNKQGMLQLFLLGDILHFAAIALLILFVVKRLPQFQYWALLLVIIVCFISPFCWDKHSDCSVINYVLQLTGGRPPRVFFPLLPWLVYPLTGLTVGYSIQHFGKTMFPWLRNFGIGFMLYGWLLQFLLVKEQSISFYRTVPADTLKHLGIVLVTLWVWEWIYTHVSGNYMFRLIEYLGQHITQVYIIQWMVIIWLLPVFGYRQLNYHQSLIAMGISACLTLALSIGISLGIHNLQSKKIV